MSWGLRLIWTACPVVLNLYFLMQFFIYREEEREKFVGKGFHKRHKNTGVLECPLSLRSLGKASQDWSLIVIFNEKKEWSSKSEPFSSNTDVIEKYFSTEILISFPLFNTYRWYIYISVNVPVILHLIELYIYQYVCVVYICF